MDKRFSSYKEYRKHMDSTYTVTEAKKHIIHFYKKGDVETAKYTHKKYKQMGGKLSFNDIVKLIKV